MNTALYLTFYTVGGPLAIFHYTNGASGPDKQIQIVSTTVSVNFLIAVYFSHLLDFLIVSKSLRDIKL